MARDKGIANFAVNFEPGGQAPLDARLLVPTVADLTNAATYSTKNYYKGMTVTVQADGSQWTLMDPENYTNIASWKQNDPAGLSWNTVD